ncbi:MAG TPA: RDD family protein [Candidatus Hydrogenedentes bacterium]|nr:RDD family protein [Candidatus Hydrogenedentota bacterium]
MTNRHNVLTIKTPEGIVFSMQLAGPTTRFLAWVIDLAVIVVIYITVFQITASLAAVSSYIALWISDFITAFAWVLLFVVNLGYGIVLEWFWRGQTIGKYVLRLRVMDEQGLRLQFSQVVIRNFLRLVDSLPVFYLFGGIACVLSKHCQRLGDFAANTVVTFSPKIAEPDFDEIMSGKNNSLRDYPHIEARLRQRITPEEARIALQAVLRRDMLDPIARVALFRQMADHLRTIVAIPEEALVGVPDEQFVRNVVDCVFRPQASGLGSAGLAPQRAPATS